MPSGKVKFFDADKGFGFVSGEDGQDVYLPASALPSGVTQVKSGTRLEYSVAEGRRGAQALSARILDAAPSLQARSRKDPEAMAVILEDLIKMLDGMRGSLNKGRYPASAQTEKIATVLRAVADDIEG
ncbi:cold-shock protein [Dermacoccaceae bacterium W4C1]